MDILELVSEHLRYRMEQNYLLIVDNVDDLSHLSEEASEPMSLDSLNRYLPFGANGFILITSRNAKLARDLTDSSRVIEVKEMNAAEARNLLEIKLQGREAVDCEMMDELSKALDYIPLAMLQAAAFLTQEKFYSAERYLKRLQSIGNPAWVKQLDCVGRPNEGFEFKKPIITTWHILFEHIWDNHRRAAILMSQMSFCDRQSIPDTIFKGDRVGTEVGGWQGDEMDSEFKEDVRKLRDYSLITEKSERTYTMHSLVQGAIQAWLVEHEEIEEQINLLISKLDKKFPDGDFESDFGLCRELFPHIQEVFKREQEVKLHFEEWDYLLFNAAQFTDFSGEYTTGLRFVKKMLGRREETGQRNYLTIEGLVNQGELLKRVGKWREAESSLLEAKQMNEEYEGDQVEMLWIIYELLLIYINSGDAAKVSMLQEEVEKIQAENLECELRKLGILSETYEFQELWDQAEEKLREILQLTKGISDEEERKDWYGRKCHTLAYNYCSQGKYADARKFLEQELNSRKDSDDNDNITRYLTYQLAEVYYLLNEYTNAKDTLLQLRNSYQECNCQDNILFGLIEYELVFIDYELDGMQDAELIKQLLEEMKEYSKTYYKTEVLGLGAMHKLAKWMKSEGRLEEAISIMTECYARRNEILVHALPNTEESLSLLRKWEEEREGKTLNSGNCFEQIEDDFEIISISNISDEC